MAVKVIFLMWCTNVIDDMVLQLKVSVSSTWIEKFYQNCNLINVTIMAVNVLLKMWCNIIDDVIL